MKIVFLGTPEFAIPSLEVLLKTPWIEVLAVCTQTDKEAGRGKKLQEPPVKQFAKEHGLNILQSFKIAKEPEVIEKIKNLLPDILITCAFGQIVNQEILDLSPHGVINVHASLLPKYRGAAPINWAILNGEKETGVSIMKTELGLDTGPVLLMEKCEIDENETSVDLAKKLSVIGANVLIKALEKIKNGEAKFIPQDNSKATKAPMLKKELGKISWDSTTQEIHNKIRGLQPWPSAYTTYQGKIIKMWESRIERIGVSGYRGIGKEGEKLPGIIVDISECITVKTKDGYLNIYKLQPESKSIINSKDWVNGAHIKTGERFI